MSSTAIVLTHVHQKGIHYKQRLCDRIASIPLKLSSTKRKGKLSVTMMSLESIKIDAVIMIYYSTTMMPKSVKKKRKKKGVHDVTTM